MLQARPIIATFLAGTLLLEIPGHAIARHFQDQPDRAGPPVHLPYERPALPPVEIARVEVGSTASVSVSFAINLASNVSVSSFSL